MMTPLLRVHDLGKRYKFYARRSDRLREWLAPSGQPRHQEFWALRHASFDLHEGEALGVIGRNGAGKSTLLKILTGTVTPTEGHFEANGRILALLELGTGFHPELSGRDNISYVAGLLGYEPAELAARVPSIIEFADLGDFIDHPVRTYSSGMFVRLAFAVHAGLEPRILIVDEALAVGDGAFQRRCLQRIEMLRDRGTAIILVSHDMTLITQFCQRALVLDHGRVIYSGQPRDAVERLHALFFREEGPLARAADASITYGDGAATIVEVWSEDHGGRRTDTVAMGKPVTFCYRVRFHTTVDQPVLGMRLATVQGVVLASTNSHLFGHRPGVARADDEWEIRWQLHPQLTPGNYFLSCGCSYPERDTFLCRRVDALRLTVIGSSPNVGVADVVHGVEVRAAAAPVPPPCQGRVQGEVANEAVADEPEPPPNPLLGKEGEAASPPDPLLGEGEAESLLAVLRRDANRRRVLRLIAPVARRLGVSRRRACGGVLDDVAELIARHYAPDQSLFSVWERHGVHVTPVAYDSPVPEVTRVPERRWVTRSELLGVDMREASQLALLAEVCAPLRGEYETFADDPTSVPYEYFRNQPWFCAVDAEILFCLVRHRKPRLVVEIGSGFSTRIAAAALVANAAAGHSGELIAIEPNPSELLQHGMPGLSELRTQRLQDSDRRLFDRLGAGDILFIDSSHVVHVDSDARDLILDIVPRLRPGVLVHFHDIFLPADYPRDWIVDHHRLWNEQYLVQAFLAFNHTFEVVWAGSYMHLHHPERLRQVFSSYDPATVQPGSLWIRRVGDR